MKDNHKGHRKRLKERFGKSPSAIPDYELMELILGYVIRGKDVKDEAKELLKFIGNNFNNLYTKDILQVEGIGAECKLFFDVIREFSSRLQLHGVKSKDIKSIRTPEDIFDFIKMAIGLNSKESFLAVALNSAGNILEHKILFTGTVNFSVVHIREIVEFAVKSFAVSVIIAHNHPSGQLTPSNDDIAITRKIDEALKLLDIGLLDHIIVSQTGSLSMLREGYFKR
jgi:DNA repair protein RadC